MITYENPPTPTRRRLTGWGWAFVAYFTVLGLWVTGSLAVAVAYVVAPAPWHDRTAALICAPLMLLLVVGFFGFFAWSDARMDDKGALVKHEEVRR